MQLLVLAPQFCTKPKGEDLFHKIQRKSHTEKTFWISPFYEAHLLCGGVVF